MKKRDLFGNGKMHVVDIFVESRSIQWIYFLNRNDILVFNLFT